jgi:hypothetical protein
VEEMVTMHGIGDSQTLESFPCAHRFEAGNGEADFRLRAKFDEFNENLRGGEVDFDDASGQNLTLESRRSGGDAIDRTSGFGPEVNCENRP